MGPKYKKKAIPENTADTKRKAQLDWPPFERFSSSEANNINIVHPDQIITIPHLWSSKQCSRYVSFLSTLPLSTTPAKAKRGDAVRVNDRYQVEDAAFAERLWSETNLKNIVLGTSSANDLRLKEHERKALWKGDVVSLAFPLVRKSLILRPKVGLNPNIRVYRYKKGQFFDKHCE